MHLADNNVDDPPSPLSATKGDGHPDDLGLESSRD